MTKYKDILFLCLLNQVEWISKKMLMISSYIASLIELKMNELND